jgi:anion-transporting  ArsA/GET3 family ATPase
MYAFARSRTLGAFVPGDLFAKRLVVVSGKGGVGKTVISSALAQVASARGMNVLLVTMDDNGRAAQLFESEQSVGDRITPLRGGVSGLYLDPSTVAADYFHKQLRVRALVRHIMGSRLFQNWFRVTPAIKEMICLGKVWDLVEESSWWRNKPTWDLIVFDAPATGHGLGLLGLPEQASKLLMGPLRKNALGVQAMLENAMTTGLLIVTIPEEMPVQEAVHFYDQAQEHLRVPLEGVVLNAISPERFTETPDVEPILADPQGSAALEVLVGARVEAAVSALTEAADYSAARARMTARYRSELEERVDLPLVEVPHVFSELFGFTQLQRVADSLERALLAHGLLEEAT